MIKTVPMNKPPVLPLGHRIDLSDVTLTGSTFDVVPDAAAAADLAKLANVRAVRAFCAQVTVKRLTETQFLYLAEVRAEVEQMCVVTLEPLTNSLTFSIRRELHYARMGAQNQGELTLTVGDEDVPDVIENLHFDLSAPVIEEFLLNIDPYPRKDGASFAAENGGDPPDNPFSVLKAWKKNDET